MNETAATTSSGAEPESAALRRVRVAVVGLGRDGIVHTALLAMIPGCEVVGIADDDPALGRVVRGMGHRVPSFRRVETMLAKTTPEAVFLCTASATHHPLARRLLEAGCALFVEPPFMESLEVAEALAALASERGSRVCCGYTLGHVPIFAAAGDALRGGALGTLQQARCSMTLPRFPGPTPGGALPGGHHGRDGIPAAASQLVSLLDSYFGAPVEVTTTWNRLYGEVEDEMRAMMRLPSGAHIGLDCTYGTRMDPAAAVVIEITGDNGRLLASNDAMELDLQAPRGRWGAGNTRVANAELPQRARFDVDGEGRYLADEAFLAWISGGPEPPHGLATAMRVQRVLHALDHSAREGGKPAAVPR